MPGSIRTIDATSQRYDPEESLPSSPEHRADPIKKREPLIELPPSPADSDIAMRHASPRGGSPSITTSTSATTREEQRITRNIDRGTPGDQAIFSDAKTPEQKQIAKRKSQYYQDVFSARESNSSARERVLKESPILADVRTNVIISDEYTFITDLSYHLSTRYQRPENSIVVTVAHSCCMLFGGNFDPAYTLTITAVNSQLQPVTNKRNATLLAKAMEESLGVAPNRGVVKFLAMSEDNLATDGKTITGEIEELEKENAESNSSLQGSLSKSTAKSKRRHSMRSLRTSKNTLPTHNELSSPTPPMSARSRETPPLPAIPSEKSPMDLRAEKAQKMGRRKSFIATIFGKAG
ncbi:Tautomerase/MIF superfamily [Hyaloscypha sp. PMI_1271]|nr:Tautomerase/MIF superfamily [Hyaloscypha sp. PMI_1271]